MRTMDAAMHALLAERGEDEPGRISAETYPHAPMSREGFAQVRALSATCGLRISAETGACPWDGRGMDVAQAVETALTPEELATC